MSLPLTSSNISDPFDNLKNQIESRLRNNTDLTNAELGDLSSKINAIAQTAHASLKDDFAKLENDLLKLHHLDATYPNTAITKEIVQNLEDISKKWPFHLHKNEITSDPVEAQKIKEAKALAAIDGYVISQVIQSFRIKNQKALVDIAKIAANQNGWKVSEHIQKYGITDEEQLFEIAKIAASQSGSGTSRYVQNYGITDPEKRFEVAKIAASRNGKGTSQDISNYEISDEDKLFEIAKIAASNHGAGTSQYIPNYEITDEDKLFEIAKIAANQDGQGASVCLENYAITDQDKRFEIAKIAASQNGEVTSKFIPRYNLNEQQQTEVFLIACINDTKNLKLLNWYQISADFSPFFNDLGTISFTKLQSKFGAKWLEQFKSLFEAKWPGQFKGVFEEISKLDNTKDQRQLENAREWLIKTAVYMHLKIPKLLDPELWKRIYQYRDPAMRTELSALATELLSNQQKYTNYSNLFQNVEHLRIPLLYLCQRANPAEFRESIEAIRKERSFREGPRLKGLIDVLHQLKEVGGQLSNQEINILLKKAIETQSKDKIRTNLFAIQGIIACGGLDDLKQAIVRQDLNLPQIYQTVFRRVINVGEVTDFASRYERTFGRSTLPASLLTYASRLKQLPTGDREKALSLLGVFVRAVLNETYAIERYNTQHSPHLSKVLKGDLEQRWKESRTVELGVSEAEAEKTFDYRKFLHTKIITDKHLDNKTYPAIVEYLTNGDASIRERLDAEIASHGEEADPKLILQRNLIDVAAGIKEPEQLQQLLKGIKEQLERLPAAELKNDIKGLTQKKPLGDSAKWTLENTDDFDVMLNCGTHVAGSCQRVDGDPNKNKGLLSYLMDGKNRMLAIRNEKGVTVARCIFRLLHNQETGEPLLFQERIYPDMLDSRLEEALNRFAIEEAKRLSLSLYTEGDDPAAIESLGGRAPWEYVDAAGGVKPDSRYIITAAKRIL